MMKRTTKALLLISLVYILSFFYYDKWEQGSIINGGDNGGYYCYLPATFIHGDLNHLRYTAHARDKYAGIETDTAAPTSFKEAYFNYKTPVIKYTYGIALLESPSFFIAHLLAKIFGWEADGYSPVYMFCIHLWSLLFAIIGLWLLHIALLYYFKETVVSVIILGIGLGTNLYHFSVYNIGMSHSFLFKLYAVLILFTIKFHKQPNWKNAAAVGLAAGMITIIRPNEIICLFIPLFYQITSFAKARTKVTWLLKQKSLLICVLAFTLCIIPQLIYWKTMSGHWLFYSYGSESFDFRHPKILLGLFGYKNGWLPYTPIMWFAVAGIPLLFFKKSDWLLPIASILPIHIYIIYSWWCWQYISGIGSRPMIELYPLLSIPLGVLLTILVSYKPAKVAFMAILVLLISHQLMLTYQLANNLVYTEDSTKTFYWQTFFKRELNMNDLIVYDTDETQPDNLKFSRQLYFNDFEDSINANFVSGICGNGRSFVMTDSIPFSPEFRTSIAACKLNPGDWIKISSDACNIYSPGGLYTHASLLVNFIGASGVYKEKFIRIQNKVTNTGKYGIWKSDYPASGKIYFFTQVPETAKPTDVLLVFGWNTTSSRVAIDNMCVEVWK